MGRQINRSAAITVSFSLFLSLSALPLSDYQRFAGRRSVAARGIAAGLHMKIASVTRSAVLEILVSWKCQLLFYVTTFVCYISRVEINLHSVIYRSLFVRRNSMEFYNTVSHDSLRTLIEFRVSEFQNTLKTHFCHKTACTCISIQLLLTCCKEEHKI